MTGGVGRRELLRGLAAAAATASPLARAVEALAIPGPPPSPLSAPSRAVVALGRREGMLSRPAGPIALPRMREALGAAVARAAGEGTPVAAMRRLFSARDVVGIKVNCIAGRGLSTRPEVALQLAAWLAEAGVRPERIVIWDRTERELKSAGFTPGASSGPHVAGTDGDWERRVREWGPSASRFSRLLAEDLTALIDLPVMKDHGLAGLSLGMKNWYGVVHNPNKLHEEACQPFVPHLSAYPLVREKLRLTVVDATTAQWHAGPSYSPAWAVAWQGFLASTDVVAVDATGLRIMEEERRRLRLKPLAAEGREPKYVEAAARLGLGVADAAKIEVATV